MMHKSLRKSVVGAAFAAATLLGCVQSAQAITVVGRWDPLYGPAFPGLGWNGEASWDIPIACLSLTATITNNSNASCALSDLKVKSATIGFYDFGADANSTLDDVAKGSLTWTGVSPQEAFPKVTGMSFSGGAMTAVTTKRFDWLEGPTSYAGVDDFYFALQFEILNGLPQARLYYGKCEIEDGDDHDDSNDGYRRNKKGDYEKECDKVGSNAFAQFPAVVKFQPVPEPQTLALILAGVGALGFTSRRRRRT